MSPLLKKDSFDSSKCVSLLELTLQRIKILRSKRSIIAKQSRDDVAKLLQRGQDANAVARVEHAFREENIAGAYDLLEQYCQLLIKRISVIKSAKECPSELKEAIASLIYAAPRCGDLQELQKLRDIFTSKCGADYSAAALEQRPEGSVNQQIIQKLSGRPPNSDTRLNLLKEIAREYKIDWNYQKAVAASFKNGETSMPDKQKVSKSPSQVSKGAMSTNADNEKPPAPVSMHQEEQASTAVHIAIPSKSNNAYSQPKDFVRANQASDVARQPPIADIKKPSFDSLHRDGGQKSHASAAAQNTSPSTTHSSSSNPREFVGASKKSIVGSPTTVDKEKPHDVPKHQVSLKEKESLPAHADNVPSTMHRAIPKQKDFIGTNQISDTGLHAGANNHKRNSITNQISDTGLHAGANNHRDELKGQPSIANPSRNSNSLYEDKGFASPSHMGTPQPASVVTHQDGLVERTNSAVPSTADNNVSRPKSFANPIQVPDVSIPKSPERRKSELNRLKGQATSTPDIDQARVFSSKPAPHSILNHETNGSAESSAAKQYVGAHKSYVKADMGRGEQYRRSMENSGANVRPKHGTHSPHVDPPRQEGKMDYKNVSLLYEQVQEPKRTPQAMDEVEDTSYYEYCAREQPKGTQYYAREQPRGTHYQSASNASSHESASFSQMSKDREWGGKNAFSSQARHQEEENYHRNPSTLHQLSKGHATRPSAHSELDNDLADLETATESAFVSAVRAADAAKAAIDMVRTSSMRSKADRKVGDLGAFQREAHPKTHLNSSRRDGRTSAEGLFGMMDSDYSSERKSSEGQEIRRADAFRPIVQGLSPDSIKDEHERKHYIHPSTHAEMLSINTEIRVAPRVQKTVLVSTQDLKHETVTSIRKKEETFNHSNIKNEQKKHENNKIYTEAHQEQEPVFFDTEMPQFDDYSSYESSEEEPPFYTKGRAATARKNEAQEKAAPNKRSPFVEQGPVSFANESIHSSVREILQQDFSGSLENDVCAESVEFLSPRSSCSSNQHSIFSAQSEVQHYHKSRFDEYEESDNALRWSSATPMRSDVSGVNTSNTNGGMATHHREQQGRSSASKAYVDTEAIRWGATVPEGPTRDVSKQRWSFKATDEVDAQPPLQAHIRASQHDHPALATQDSQAATRKHFGISRRSVRSSRLT